MVHKLIKKINGIIKIINTKEGKKGRKMKCEIEGIFFNTVLERPKKNLKFDPHTTYKK